MPARKTAVPTPLLDLPPQQQRNFEADFVRVSPTSSRMRKAGREYVAMGWRMAYDSLYGRRRRRKAPWECRQSECQCRCHSA